MFYFMTNFYKSSYFTHLNFDCKRWNFDCKRWNLIAKGGTLIAKGGTLIENPYNSQMYDKN